MQAAGLVPEGRGRLDLTGQQQVGLVHSETKLPSLILMRLHKTAPIDLITSFNDNTISCDIVEFCFILLEKLILMKINCDA